MTKEEAEDLTPDSIVQEVPEWAFVGVRAEGEVVFREDLGAWCVPVYVDVETIETPEVS